MSMPKSSALQPQVRPLGKIEVLPNAIHSIAVQAVCGCYGVVGIASSRLRNGQAILLTDEQSSQGVQVRLVNDQIILEVYVVLEYGLRISEIAHNIMSSVKYSTEKMLGVPVAQGQCQCAGLTAGKEIIQGAIMQEHSARATLRQRPRRISVFDGQDPQEGPYSWCCVVRRTP